MNVDLTATEIPTARADLVIERTLIPHATEPLVVVSPEVSGFASRLDFEAANVSNFLRQLGCDEPAASSFMVEFISPERAREKYEGPLMEYCVAFHASNYLGPDELVYGSFMSVQVTEEIMNSPEIFVLNHTLRHEIGHMIAGDRFGDKRLYHSDLPRSRKIGNLPVFAVARIGEYVGIDKKLTLHAFDREERFCEKFARQHADFNPIGLKNA